MAPASASGEARPGRAGPQPQDTPIKMAVSVTRGSCARALLHRSSAAWSSQRFCPVARGRAAAWPARLRGVAPWRGCLSSLRAEPGRPWFGHYRAAAVDDEEQDGRVVERARCCRVRRDLGCSPGGEGEDGHEPQEAVPTLGRSADADGGDGGGDKEQRGGGDTGERWAQVTLPRMASAAASRRPPRMEITPRLIAMASRARAAFPGRGREVTCLTVSRPEDSMTGSLQVSGRRQSAIACLPRRFASGARWRRPWPAAAG